MTQCLITGCEGFIGSHLADFLVARGQRVYGSVYERDDNLAHLSGRIELLEGDLRDRTWVEEVIGWVKPDIVFHLAAQSFVTVSWENPALTLETNVQGSFNLLDSVYRSGGSSTVVVVGSSSVYGPRSDAEMPLDEETSFRPTSMYAVSKVAEDMLGSFYSTVYNMRVMRVRPFNMTGPRKRDDACSDFAQGIAEVERGIREALEVGNLDTVRDFTDGRDAVRALWLIADKGKSGEVYNLCSGVGRRMSDVLDLLCGLSTSEISCKVSPAKLRPFDDPIYVGSNAKLRSLGWEPEIPFETTMLDALNLWRASLG
jgi:GDP-4-dehydro-6-deoxy-D-mannose reductase